MTNERVRREDPSRTEPMREWRQLFRGPESQGNESEASHHNGGSQRPWESAITDAVNLGYRIIEEQMNQGKRVAEQISTRTYTTNSIGDDASELVRRLLRFYTDIGSTCLEFVDSVSRSTVFQGNLREWVDGGLGRGNNNTSEMTSQPATNGHGDIPIDIASAQPVRIALDLNGTPDRSNLHIGPLKSLDGCKPELARILFDYSSGLREPILRVRIPSTQPADTYTGVIIDTRSKRAVGNLSIEICTDSSE